MPPNRTSKNASDSKLYMMCILPQFLKAKYDHKNKGLALKQTSWLQQRRWICCGKAAPREARKEVTAAAREEVMRPGLACSNVEE